MNTSPESAPRSSFAKLWGRLASLPRWAQILLVVVILIIVGGIVVFARGGSAPSAAATESTVTLQSVGSFVNGSDGAEVSGTVQSVSEADLLAQSGGTVEAVNTKLGATVPAGFVIASLDSSAAAAAVLQAQGAYDAALAAQSATNLQAQNSVGSLAEEQTAIRTTYQTDYTTLNSAIISNVDVFFGANTPVGPALLLNPLTTGSTLPRERRDITTLLANWQASLATANTTDPLTLLSSAQSNLETVSTFLTNLADLAAMQGSAATPAQLANLATAQSTVNSLLAGISSARTAYNTAATTAAVGQTQSSSGQGITSSEATVEEALGGLRSAQAAYEKTVVRAPIAGTVNYLQIHVGDYVTPNQHVATVAQNNALQVVMELSQDNANRLAVGDTVTIDNTYKGIVTTIAPALDPTTEEIEVDVAVDAGSDLVNGQSVQVALPALPTDANSAATGSAAGSASSSTASSTASTVEVPLTAVKLLPNERDVFTVDATGHLVAHSVTIGNVVGDLIQITSPLDPSLEIVTDARGLSAGDAVLVASSTVSGASGD